MAFVPAYDQKPGIKAGNCFIYFVPGEAAL